MPGPWVILEIIREPLRVGRVEHHSSRALIFIIHKLPVLVDTRCVLVIPWPRVFQVSCLSVEEDRIIQALRLGSDRKGQILILGFLIEVISWAWVLQRTLFNVSLLTQKLSTLPKSFPVNLVFLDGPLDFIGCWGWALHGGFGPVWPASISKACASFFFCISQIVECVQAISLIDGEPLLLGKRIVVF